jgi:hypothetical protein
VAASHPDQNPYMDTNQHANTDGNIDAFANCDTEEKGETCAGKRSSAKTAGVF